MWAVYSDADRRGSWDVEAFFQTGRAEVDVVMARLAEHGWLPAKQHVALDFGCGLGRLTRALSRHFASVIGVDVAPRMVAEAQRLNSDVSSCTFLVNDRPDLSIIESESIDLVLSFIALQHVSDKDTIRRYIRDFARITRSGGVAVFQLPTGVSWRIRYHPLRLINRGLRSLRFAPKWALRLVMSHSMYLNSLPESDVRALLAAGDLETVAVVPDNHIGSDAAPSAIYVAVRR